MAFFIPQPAISRADLLGGRLLWLLEIHFGSRKRILLAREPIAVPSAADGTWNFSGGLDEVTFSDSVDLYSVNESSRSVSISCIPPINIAELVGQGFDLTTTTASLSQIIEGEDYSDRRPVFRNVRIRDPEYGAEFEEFRFSLKSNPFEDQAMIPPIGHRVNATTWPDYGDAAYGKAYPQIFGQPGVKDTTSWNTWGSPALYVDTTGSTRRFLVAGHRCTEGSTVKITNTAKISDSAGPYAVYTATDGLGREVSLIDVPSTVAPMVLDGDAEYVVMWAGTSPSVFNGSGVPVSDVAEVSPYATGTITVDAIGFTAGDTITIGENPATGAPFLLTAVSGARTSAGNNFSISIPGSVEAQALEISEAINDATNQWRSIVPPLVGATVGGAVVKITAEAAGVAANDLPLAKSVTAPGALTLSGATLSGGTTQKEHSVHGAGDVLRYMLQAANDIPIDAGRFEAAIPLLNEIRVDFTIEEPVRIWDWLKSNLLPLLPVSLATSGDGIYPIVWDREIPSADVCAAIDADRDQWERTGPVAMEFLDGQPVNRFKISHSKNLATGTIQESSVLDASRNASDPSTDENIYAKISKSRYGIREKEEESVILYRAASAFQILSFWSRIYGFPIYSIEYMAPLEWGWLRAGSVVELTDPDLHIENQLAIVQAVEWSAGDLVGFRLSWLEDLPRDTRQTS